MKDAFSSERATIVRLIQAEWKALWTPKGRWMRFPKSPQHCYVAPSLIQTSDGLFEMGARALEVGGVEYFSLWFRAGPAGSNLDSIPMIHPGRMPAIDRPGDLEIDGFIGAPARQGVLVVDHSAETVGARIYGLILKAERGSLMFFVDEDVPESSLVTSDSAVVERICVGRELVELPLY